MGSRRVAVVGAGITGLALTHYLVERGVDVVTLEADDRPGGVIRSRRVGGRVVEVGPQRMRLTPALSALVEAVGLEDDLLTAPDVPLYVYADGALREAPLNAPAFVRTDLLSRRGKLRLLAEPLTRRGCPQETAGELFTRKFGREAYRRLLGPLYGGIYGSDPAEMPATHALSGLLEREAEAGSFLRAFYDRIGGGRDAPPVSFEDGNQQLPEALYEAHADRVELETRVTDVRSADRPSGGPDAVATAATDGGGYVVETPTASYDADRVVVTTPAAVAADLLAGVTETADRLAELTYNPLAIVHLAADVDREGFGYQVAFGEDLHTLGVSWNASVFDRDGLYTAFLGGMTEPGLVEREDAAIGQIAGEEFERVTGCPAEVLGVNTRRRWFPAWDRSWDALAEFEAPPGVHLATNYTGRLGVPSRVREARDLADRFAESHETASGG
jgi:oxygen-dependent protoporphyrinogen oxidase